MSKRRYTCENNDNEKEENSVAQNYIKSEKRDTSTSLQPYNH